jgi:hypothetical protein
MNTLHLRVGRATIHAEAVRRRSVVWAGSAGYETLEELNDVIARLAAEPPVRCRRIRVTLARPAVQVRTLTDLPPVKQAELAALVAHQAARFFRRNGAPLVCDAVWVGKGAARVARAAAVAEPLIEAIVTGARAAGLAVESIAPADESVPLLLLPGIERAARERRRRSGVRRLALAAAALWMLSAAGFYARLLLERRAVERELAALQRPLDAVLDARRTLRVASATVLAVRESERGHGRSLAALGGIGAALPDSVVLTSVTWNADGSGLLTGLARRAADVLARLERRGAVAAPRFEGPVVTEALAGRQWERFTIVFGGAGAGKREGR